MTSAQQFLKLKAAVSSPTLKKAFQVSAINALKRVAKPPKVPSTLQSTLPKPDKAPKPPAMNQLTGLGHPLKGAFKGSI